MIKAKKEILVFSWDGIEYGVPTENVCGITGNAWETGRPLFEPDHGNLVISGKPIPIWKASVGGKDIFDNNRAVIVKLGTIQIAMLVDEVLRVEGIDEGEFNFAELGICQLSRLTEVQRKAVK